MTGKLIVTQDSITHQVRETVSDLCANAEKLRRMGTALESTVGELLANAPPDELRQLAVIVKAHAVCALLGATELASKAERLCSIADICDASDSAEDFDA